jgi:hypothetical protein
MIGMWLLWLRHRWRQLGAVLVAVLSVLLVLVLVFGRSGVGVSFLGDVSAPRLAVASGPGVILPRSGDPNGPHTDTSAPGTLSSILDIPLPASAGPQTMAEAQKTWGADETAQRRNELLSAINCARQQQGQPSIALDVALSQTAGDAWLKLVRDPSWSLMRLPGHYQQRSVMTLDFGLPDSTTQAGSQQHLAGAGLCTAGGFDLATLETSADATSVGIAVFPPQAAWDMASAVVLVQ